MPELPEVETIRLDLQESLPGLRITDITIVDRRILKTNEPVSFVKELKQRTFDAIARRGKMLIIPFKEGGFLLVHLKMTGQLIYGEKLALKETKVVFSLSNGKYLNYNDQRLFGRLSFVPNLEEEPFLQQIGPEPFADDFTKIWISAQLKRRRVPIKTLLLDQHFIAGIGNIYASEILFQAKISPKKRGDRLSQSEINALHQATIRVLKEAIRFRGTSMRNYRDSNGEKGSFINRIKVYNKENEPCPVCRLEIKRIVQSGRSTFYCQRCQQNHAKTAKYI